ncbi:MAG: hypothetical protein R3C03_12070 [Pirellulaceae bacterium]
MDRTPEFNVIATDRQYLKAFFKQHHPDLVVLAACGPSGWSSDLCQELVLRTLV